MGSRTEQDFHMDDFIVLRRMVEDLCPVNSR
jgi:hypothetical protein